MSSFGPFSSMWKKMNKQTIIAVLIEK